VTTGSPSFSVLIPATRASSLPAALASIRGQTYRDWEIVVVGQGDDARVRASLGSDVSDDPRLRYVHVPVPGLSRARNAGLLAAGGDLVLMIDDDCEAAPDLLQVLLGIFERRPDVGFVGGSMLAPPKPAGGFGRCPNWDPPEEIFDPASGDPMPEGFGIVGGNMAFRRSLMVSVGLFDEHLGVGGTFPAAEDSDYLIRMVAHGVTVMSTPRAVVHHSDGWRYGVRTVLRHQRARGLGNGALAAKRTMAGDPRGNLELRAHLRQFGSSMLRLRRPAGAWYLPHYWLGYRRCLRDYTVDASGVLRLRRADAVGTVLSGVENSR